MYIAWHRAFSLRQDQSRVLPIITICHQPRIICILDCDDLYFGLRTFVFTGGGRADRPSVADRSAIDRLIET